MISASLETLANTKKMGYKFFTYYGKVFKESEFNAKEKSLIDLAVTDAVQCLYRIDLGKL